MADEIRDQIEADALTPAEVTAAAGGMKKRPLTELIEADRYLREQAASAKAHRGIRLTQCVLPGSL